MSWTAQSKLFKSKLELFHKFSLEAYLGHGRMTEACLIFVKIEYVLILLFLPRRDVIIFAFSDIGIHEHLLAIPFGLAAGIAFIGITLNALGYEISKWFRIIGASIGMTIWMFLLLKNVWIGNFGSQINPWMFMAILANVWIIRRGMLGLPIPGSHATL